MRSRVFIELKLPSECTSEFSPRERRDAATRAGRDLLRPTVGNGSRLKGGKENMAFALCSSLQTPADSAGLRLPPPEPKAQISVSSILQAGVTVVVATCQSQGSFYGNQRSRPLLVTRGNTSFKTLQHRLHSLLNRRLAPLVKLSLRIFHG